MLKTNNKTLEMVGSWASILGFIGFLIVCYVNWKFDNNPNYLLLIQSIVLIFGSLSWGMYLIYKLSSVEKDFLNLEKNFSETKSSFDNALSEIKRDYLYINEETHLFCHESRNLLNSILYSNSLSFSSVEEKFETYLKATCDFVKNIFDKLTDEECSVTIKGVTDDGDSVVTYARDRKSFNQRSKKAYLMRENTAFSEIQEHQKNCFCHNSLEKDKHYYNKNPDWINFYNCTLVVPIRCHPVDEDPNLVGYLAVDCKRKLDNNKTSSKEIFNDNEHKYRLGVFGDILYVAISQYSILREKCLENKKNNTKSNS